MDIKIKEYIKKIFFNIFKIQINTHNILTINKNRMFFCDRVLLYTENKNKIFLLEGPNNFAIDLKTVQNLEKYNLGFKLKYFNILLKTPIRIIGMLNFHTAYNAYINLPIKDNLVFFESFLGKNYSGNPKYIYEYLLSINAPYEYVWTYNGDNIQIPGNPKIVKRGSTEYFKYLAKSKYWVNNVVFPVHKKRKETIYLQTWHGTPLKRLGYDIEVDGPEAKARENFHKESRNWDFLVSQNKHSSNVFSRAFKFEQNILEYGYPHNDVLIENSYLKIKEIKNKLNIPLEKKVILYAPTWRDDDSNGNWSFNFSIKLNLQKWKEQLSSDYVLLLRMHHLITNIKGLEEVGDFVLNVSKYDDAQELSLISDIMITDYSSIFFDYAVTKKPILFYTYDYEQYLTKLRGFYLDMKSEMPGPLCHTEEELLDSVMNIDEIEINYQDKYKKFNEKFNYLDNGNCSKLVVEKVFKEI